VITGALGSLACPAGCGEWYPREAFAQLVALDERSESTGGGGHTGSAGGAGGSAPRGIDDLQRPPGGIAEDGTRAQATSWPWGAASCPACNRDMQVGFRAQVRFDYCRPHGVWLDAGEIGRFAKLFERS
jgi:hypothetical protein